MPGAAAPEQAGDVGVADALAPPGDPDGAFRQAVPLTVPSYRGLEPRLSLGYSSARGNGRIGVGWELLGIPELWRLSEARGAPTFTGSDAYFLDGARLIKCAESPTRPSCRNNPATSPAVSYSTNPESYQLITYRPDTDTWTLSDPSGVSTTLAAEAGPNGQRWLPRTVVDTLGNHVDYSYFRGAGSGYEPAYPYEIRYNQTVVHFYWERRPDEFSGVRFGGGFPRTGAVTYTRNRLRAVSVQTLGQLVRAYALEYEHRTASSGRSMLRSVQEFGSDARIAPSGAITSGASLPRTLFEENETGRAGTWQADPAMPVGSTSSWTAAGWVSRPAVDGSLPIIPGSQPWLRPQVYPADLNGDGRTDYVSVYLKREWECMTDSNYPAFFYVSAAISDPYGGWVYTPTSLGEMGMCRGTRSEKLTGIKWGHPLNQDFYRVLVGDVTGDGRDDLVTVLATASGIDLQVAESRGNGDFFFYDLGSQRMLPFSLDSRSRWFLADINGDGIKDVVLAEPSRTMPRADARARLVTVLLKSGERAIGAVRVQENATTSNDWDDPNWFVGDANGDGRADLLRVLDHEPDADHGYEHAALEVLASTGDGSFAPSRVTETDVRWSTHHFSVSNGVASRITARDMAQAGDVNGDGRTDLVFLGSPAGHVQVWTALADGTGGFEPPVRFDGGPDLPEKLLNLGTYKCVVDSQSCAPAGLAPNRWLAADFDGDGATDLAVAGRKWTGAGPTVTYLLSTRDGGYRSPSTEASSWEAGCYVAGLWLGDFEPYAATCKPDDALDWVFPGDVDGNGTAELMRAEFLPLQPGGRTVQQLRFTAAPRAASSIDDRRWMPADVTGDGLTDLVYVQPLPRGIRITTAVRHGNEYRLAPPSVVLTDVINPPLSGWQFGDVNGDGRADLLNVVRDTRFPYDADRWFTAVAISAGEGQWSAECTLADGRCAVAHRAVPAGGVRIPAGSPNWQALDVNGDGRTDLAQVDWVLDQNGGRREAIRTALSTGTGWIWYSQIPVENVWPNSVRGWRPADVDGDGRADLVRVSNVWDTDHNQQGGSRIETVLSKLGQCGPLWTPTGPGGTVIVHLPADTVDWRPARLNDDGYADLLHVAADAATGQVIQQPVIGLGTGEWSTEPVSATFAGTDKLPLGPHRLMDISRWPSGDMNGDGNTDLARPQVFDGRVWVTSLDASLAWPFAPDTVDAGAAGSGPGRTEGHWTGSDTDGDGQTDLVLVSHDTATVYAQAYHSAAPRDLLTTVTTPLGARIAAVYGSSADIATAPSPKEHLPLGTVLPTVRAVTTDPGHGPRDTTSYSYERPRWSGAERTFLGFTTVRADRAAATNRPATVTKTTYEFPAPGQANPVLVERTTGDAIERATSTYDPISALLKSRQHERCQPTCLTTSSSYTYDQYGDVTTQVDSSGDVTAALRITTLTYTAGAPYIVRLRTKRVSAIQPGKAGIPVSSSRLLSSSRYCYDNDQTSPCTALPTYGLRTSESSWDDVDGHLVVTRYDYDDYGNLTTVTDPVGQRSTTEYDPDLHILPTRTCNNANECEHLFWNTAQGLQNATADANATTVYGYDTLGRPVTRRAPTGGLTTTSYPNWGDPQQQRVRTVVDDGSSTGLWSEEFQDGLGRTYRQVTKADPADDPYYSPQRLHHSPQRLRETGYSDASTRPSEVTGWYIAPATPHIERYTYDGLGRLLTQTHPDGAVAARSYRTTSTLSLTVVRDESGHERTLATDAWDHLSSVTEPGGGVSSYQHDLLDRLVATVDARGSTTAFGWDALGRLRWRDGPDSGRWSWRYNDAGDLTQQTDATGALTTFGYDDAGRLSSRQSADGTSRWHYSEPGHSYGVGRVTSVEDPSQGSCARSSWTGYDPAGHVTWQAQCILGHTKHFSYSYDIADRQHTITYPDGQDVEYGYDTAGNLNRVSGVVTDLTHDPAGTALTYSLANGVVESYGYDSRGWLRQINDRVPGRAAVFDSRYNYAPTGLLTASDSGTVPSLTYGYDKLDRLLTAQAATVPESPVPFPSLPPQAYSYDSTGNITQSPDLGSYDYLPPGATRDCSPGAACAGPHAVQRTRTDPRYSPGLRSYETTFRYDANGQLRSRFDERTGTSLSIDWNAAGQATRFTQTGRNPVSYVYDAAGARVAELTHAPADTTTRRFFGLLAEEDANGQLTKHYLAGSRWVASATPTSTVYYHIDRLGSVRATTNQNGTRLAVHNYGPYGQSYELKPNPPDGPNALRFAGHPIDHGTGFVYMGARYLDPDTGRFISPDTAAPDLTNPQSLNPYTYANDNPLGFIDPTGHEPIEADPTCTEVCEEQPPELPDWGVTVAPPAENPRTSDVAVSASNVPVEAPSTSHGTVTVEEGAITGAYINGEWWPTIQRGDKFYPIPRNCDAGCMLAQSYPWAELNSALQPLALAAASAALLPIGALAWRGESLAWGVEAEEAAGEMAAEAGAAKASAAVVAGGTAAAAGAPVAQRLLAATPQQAGIGAQEIVAGLTDLNPRIPSLLQTANYRVLDMYSSWIGIGEVKYVSYQGLTQQLSDMILWAQGLNVPFYLITRYNTILSGPLKDLVNQGAVQWIPALP